MADEINTNENTPEIPDDIQAEVKVRFELLPPDVQKVVADSNYAKDLFDIAKANKLTYEQLETLQLETFMALLGMNKPDEYRSFLQSAFKKTDAEMDVLVSAINERVFDPIKESMKQVYGQQDDDLNNPEIAGTQEATDALNEAADEDVSETETAGSSGNFFAGSMNSSTSGGQVTSTTSLSAEPEKAPAPANLPGATVIPIRKIAVSQPQQSMPAQSVFTPSNSSSGLSQVEENVLGKAGVVLGESQNNTETPKQAESAMPDRNELMKGIENPVKSSPSGTIMANKLSTSATLMPNKTTDYSLPRTTPQSTTPVSSPAPTSGDP